jgi:hypothetical protein
MASVRGRVVGQKGVKVAKLIATMIKFVQSKSCKLVNYSGKVHFIVMGGIKARKSLDVGSKGIKLVLDGGDVDGDGDVDVGHFGGDGADGVKNNVVIGGGGGRELYCRMGEEGEERDCSNKGFRCKE